MYFLVRDHSIFTLSEKAHNFDYVRCMLFFYIAEYAQQSITFDHLPTLFYALSLSACFLIHIHHTSSELNGVHLGTIALLMS